MRAVKRLRSGITNVRSQATVTPPQKATLGALETVRISAELGRLRTPRFGK
jgi:hypothetical protein